jgi:7-cyano-7-deazaguanine synthase in queuosine biosynthesis
MYTNLICDFEFKRPYWSLIDRKGKTVYLSADPAFGNVFLNPLNLARDLGQPLDPVSLDLCEIAAYVYLGDKAVSRGRYEKWTRNLSFVVPVREPDRWNSIKELLANTVSTLSGDNIRFNFVAKEKPDTELPGSLELQRFPDSDCSCLFSGGLDSLAGATYLIQQGRRPLFASHYAGGSLRNIQHELLGTIEKKFGQEFHHFQYRVTSRFNKKSPHKYVRKESSHRARSFLFMSFAAVAAAARGLSDIYICENGVMSMNVPISDARKGSRSTRHAHPLYLSYFTKLINTLYEREFKVENPFFVWTKGQEVELLKKANLHTLIRKTVTCWGYPNLTLRYKHSNHCGHCLPCIVRRVSLIAAGMDKHDDQYVVDVFGARDKLSEAQLRNLEDLEYFCQNFQRLENTDLIYRYPELIMIEALNAAGPTHNVEQIIQVYKKFAAEFTSVAKKMRERRVSDVLACRRVPTNPLRARIPSRTA